MPHRTSESCSPSPWVEHVLPTKLDVIRSTERELLGCLVEHDYTEDERFAVRLAFEEAIINAMKHGNKMNPTLSVRLRYQCGPEAVRIGIADEGEGFDPTGVPDPTADENLQRPCGRGVMLIRSYMDEVRYSREDRELMMVKYRRP